MYRFLQKNKWYLVTALGLAAFVLLCMFNLQDDFAKELNGWLFDKKAKIIEEDLSYRREKIAQSDEQLAELDKQEAEIKKKREEKRSNIDTMDLKEMSDAWKKLGY